MKAEHLDEDSLDETDLNTVVSMDEWRSRVRKLNLLLKYLERLVSGDADVRGDYPNIRILASNTKVIEEMHLETPLRPTKLHHVRLSHNGLSSKF